MDSIQVIFAVIMLALFWYGVYCSYRSYTNSATLIKKIDAVMQAVINSKLR